MLKVDLGCGGSKPEGFIGVDIVHGEGVDIVADLREKFPFPDASVDEIRAYDTIEHLPDKIHTMNEIWRVCKPGARVDILVPSTDGRGAFQDPTHVSFWNINSFYYYCIEFPAHIKLCKKYGFKGAFRALKLENRESSDKVIHVEAVLTVLKKINDDGSNENSSYEESLKKYADIGESKSSSMILAKKSIDQDNKFFATIINNIKVYQKFPDEISAIANLRKARREIAEQCLSYSEAQLERQFSSEFGNVYKLLIESGIKDELLTEIEEAFVTEIQDRIFKDTNQEKLTSYLLVVMLYCYAYQVPIVDDLTKIPAWFLKDYLKFIFSVSKFLRVVGEADKICCHIQRWADYIHGKVFDDFDTDFWQGVASIFIEVANFIHVYLNEKNLKDIYSKRAEILKLELKNKGYQLNYEFFTNFLSKKKIRLGILASHFTPAAETYASLPVYEYLSREFEVILYSLSETNHPLEQYCRSCANSFKLLPEKLNDQVNFIREEDLDLLFIATNVTAVTNKICLLSLHRLARVQITSVASVVTTGIPNIDYYISGELTDRLPESQQHYREKLIRLDGTAHCFSYEPNIEQTRVDIERASLGIPEEAVVFISGANFYKLIPELSDTWAKIVAAIPNSVLLLLPFGPNWSNTYPQKAFREHLKSKFSRYGVAADRLMILAPQPVPDRQGVKEYYKIADIYLDSYPFSGTTSLIEPLEVGLPIVTRQGTHLRAAMGAAILKTLDLTNCIVESEEAYIQQAIAFGTNADLREQTSDRIKRKMQSTPSFLDSRSYSAKIGAVFQELVLDYQANLIANRLNLRDINLIAFPDWSQSEEILYQDLARVIKVIAAHPDLSRITLLVDISNIAEEDASLALSGVMMNLLMEESLDVSEELEISLVEKLGDREWQALLLRIQGRIELENNNRLAIASAKAESIPVFKAENLSNIA